MPRSKFEDKNDILRLESLFNEKFTKAAGAKIGDSQAKPKKKKREIKDTLKSIDKKSELTSPSIINPNSELPILEPSNPKRSSKEPKSHAEFRRKYKMTPKMPKRTLFLN